MEADTLDLAKRQLSSGPPHSFRDPIDPAIPRVAAGCYTIWDDTGRFIYAGMAGRGLTAEAIDLKKSDPKAKETGIRDRLKAHRDGRRSGDQFSVYVFDRLVLSSLTQEQLAAAVAGKRKLDEDVQKYIHEHLHYRWWETPDSPRGFGLRDITCERRVAGNAPSAQPPGGGAGVIGLS